jgi:hypothetical protein
MPAGKGTQDMVCELIGVTKLPVRLPLMEDSAEVTLNWWCRQYRPHVVYVIRRMEECGNMIRVWVRARGVNAYEAYLQYCEKLPLGPGVSHTRKHAEDAFDKVGTNATAAEFRHELIAQRALCHICDPTWKRPATLKKPIKNEIVKFGVRSRAHWDSSVMNSAVGEYSVSGGRRQSHE